MTRRAGADEGGMVGTPDNIYLDPRTALSPLDHQLSGTAASAFS